MRKQYSERSIYDNSLRQLDGDKDTIWNKDRRNQVRSNMLINIKRLERRTKIQTSFKYVSSFGVFVVLLLFGYQFLLSDITHNSEEISTAPQPNQTQTPLIVDDSDEVEDKEDIGDSTNGNENNEMPKKNFSRVTKEELSEYMDLRLPTYIPDFVNIEPQYVKRDYIGGTSTAEVKYVESEKYFINFTQTKLDISRESAIDKIKNVMYENEVLEEIEIARHPSFLRLEGDDTSYYSSLHIITNKYSITLTTHGIEKGEIMKIANSIDLSGL